MKDLYTLGTVMVDYRGYRVVCQTIIPGLLQKEHEAAVVYGSIDAGKNISSEPRFCELVSGWMRTLNFVQTELFTIYLHVTPAFPCALTHACMHTHSHNTHTRCDIHFYLHVMFNFAYCPHIYLHVICMLFTCSLKRLQMNYTSSNTSEECVCVCQ